MIDIKLLRENPDLVRASQRTRGEDETIVDTILAADERRRSSLQAFEQARSEQKSVSKGIGAAMGKVKAAQKAGEPTEDLEREAQAARDAATELSNRVKELEAAANQAGEVYETALRSLGNIVKDGVPAGGEDNFNTLETVGTTTTFDFEPLDHLALGEKLGAIDMSRGAKVSGARFYFLKGAGARLSQALMAYAQSIAYEEGFTPLAVPTMVNAATMGGTGYLDAHDDVYRVADADLYLTGTSEVALAGFHTDEIIDLAGGPLRYTATSTCYRKEAGSYGKDTRGIFRVHQFTKTEMFIYCRPEDAVAEHDNLLRIEKRLLDGLELPYRVIDVAAGDLGGSAARKYDCEAWVPTQGKYRELTSTSNTTQFQARRLGIRYRTEEGKTDYVATLNGTMLTDTRPIVALLENHQQADGSVRVPRVLQPYLGTDVLTPL
ncbi:serine--tRNA ligase [Demetria terragena]|uniref:serine--tRNA ligase n=1 Tax=Demetria terragena TaxID=63959 RepID=UPI0003709465|nr:serine--tRNA ligase [Demetria terragena]